MAYQPRDGDILSLSHEKAGALTMSVPLFDWPGDVGDPAELWQSQAAVRIVTGYIARKVSAIPFHLYKRVNDTDRQRITDTPVARMLRTPVPGRGWSRYLEQHVLDMAVWDRWASLITVDDAAQPILRRLPANRIAIETKAGEPVAVVVFGDKAETSLSLDQVLFDVAPSAMPSQLDRGAPRLTTLSSILAELDEMGVWRRQVAQNGPRVPAVIERPKEAGDWSDDAYNRFKTSWDEYKRGGGREGGTPILEDGMKMHEFSPFKPDDAAGTTHLRAMSIEEAAMLFGIPPELVGVRPGNYSNVQAYREVEYVDVLGSWVTNFENALNVGLLGAGLLAADEYVEAAVEARLRGAFEQQAGVLSTSVGAPWLTRNEARARQNLPAIDGGDEIITPLNVLIGGQASPQDGITSGGGGGDVDQLDEGDELGDDEAKSLGLKAPVELPVDLAVQAGWPEIIAQRNALTRELTRFARAQHARIVQAADQIERAGGIGTGAKSAASTATLDEWIQQTPELRKIVQARGTGVANAGAQQVLDAWNPLATGFEPEQMTAWLMTVGRNDADLWAVALSQRIAELLGDVTAWATFLEDAKASDAMAKRYGRTWGTEFAEFGRHDAARSSGLRMKTWRTTSSRPRPEHAAMSGTSVPISEPFPNGCEYPGDWTGGADEVANCRCTVTYGVG